MRNLGKDNAAIRTRLMPDAGISSGGIRTVFRAYWRAEPGAAWQTVRNAAGEPIAYREQGPALAAAELMRLSAGGPFSMPLGGRELYLGPTSTDCAFLFIKGKTKRNLVGHDGEAFTLSPTEADTLGRLIGEALNAYPAAVAWARGRAAK